MTFTKPRKKTTESKNSIEIHRRNKSKNFTSKPSTTEIQSFLSNPSQQMDHQQRTLNDLNFPLSRSKKKTTLLHMMDSLMKKLFRLTITSSLILMRLKMKWNIVLTKMSQLENSLQKQDMFLIPESAKLTIQEYLCNNKVLIFRDNSIQLQEIPQLMP